MILFLFLALPARAAEPQLMGQFGDWLAYRHQEAAGPVCYAMARPESTVDAKQKPLRIRGRGQVLLQITRRPAEGDQLVVSYVAGQGIKRASTVTLKTDKATIKLKPSGDTAWTDSSADDAAAAAAIRAGKRLSVMHKNTKDVGVTDHFSLKGSSAAIKAITGCQ